MKKIITIGGGNGQPVILRALKKIDNIKITAIVSMLDDGGSTGRLCQELDVLPPGDAMKCLSALSQYDLHDFLVKRFRGADKIRGHSVGNMLLTMLSGYTGSFESGLSALGDVLESAGEVLPVSLEKGRLIARYTNGETVSGQHLIDEPANHRPENRIESLEVRPKIEANSRARQTIKEADFIIFGPGDLHTSILACVIIPGIKEALVASRAKIVFVTNLMTKKGQTHGLGTRELVDELSKYVGRSPDYVLVNDGRINESMVRHYEADGENMIPHNLEDFSGTIIKRDMIDNQQHIKDMNDPLVRSILKHSSEKLQKVIEEII